MKFVQLIVGLIILSLGIFLLLKTTFLTIGIIILVIGIFIFLLSLKSKKVEETEDIEGDDKDNEKIEEPNQEIKNKDIEENKIEVAQ